MEDLQAEDSCVRSLGDGISRCGRKIRPVGVRWEGTACGRNGKAKAGGEGGRGGLGLRDGLDDWFEPNERTTRVFAYGF